MRLYLSQHAEAVPGDTDAGRTVSPEGRKALEKTADFAARIPGMNIAALYHSGKTRARQSAEILAGKIDPVKGMIAAEGLNPGDDPAVWSGRLEKIDDDIMIVGHLPHLGKLVSRLLCGDDDKGAVTFTNGCVLCMERGDTGSWSVRWMLAAEMLGG